MSEGVRRDSSRQLMHRVSQLYVEMSRNDECSVNGDRASSHSRRNVGRWGPETRVNISAQLFVSQREPQGAVVTLRRVFMAAYEKNP